MIMMKNNDYKKEIGDSGLMIRCPDEVSDVSVVPALPDLGTKCHKLVLSCD